MKKNEIIKEIKETLKAIENREVFCKENKIKEEDFYPSALGYLEGELNYILRKIKEN